jgi:hypothetical protein
MISANYDNLVYNLQVGVRTVRPQPYTNIGLPNDKHSDYHFDWPIAYYIAYCLEQKAQNYTIRLTYNWPNNWQ